jgi:hypothetical protein
LSCVATKEQSAKLNQSLWRRACPTRESCGKNTRIGASVFLAMKRRSSRVTLLALFSSHSFPGYPSPIRSTCVTANRKVVALQTSQAGGKSHTCMCDASKHENWPLQIGLMQRPVLSASGSMFSNKEAAHGNADHRRWELKFQSRNRRHGLDEDQVPFADSRDSDYFTNFNSLLVQRCPPNIR